MYIERQSDGTYKFYNKKWGGVLFCADDSKDGDRWAWFHPNRSYEGSGRARWRIEKQADGYFKVINVHFGGPLFCGDSESGGDHWAWVEPRPDYEYQGKERWEIQKQHDSDHVDCGVQ